jgi:DNA-binding NarL/FixJ family response regulator
VLGLESPRAAARAARLPSAMIRVLIADDHAIVRAGLKQFLAGEPDLEIAGEAATGEEAIALVRAGGFDVVLLDISLPDRSGVDVLKTLRDARPELPVLILSAFAEEQYALNLLRAGAAGYLNKAAAQAELVSAIRAAAQGRKYVSAALAQILAEGAAGDAEPAPHAQLSRREFQIFCRLAAGQGATQIAAELFLSVKTVSTYRARILQKMNMQSNADLTYYAVKNGLIR